MVAAALGLHSDGMTMGASAGDVIALHLGSHHLAERADEGGLLDAAGRCGIQDSPPGSALLALNARVQSTPEQVAAAVGEERTLLRTWCTRGSPFVVPAARCVLRRRLGG